MDLVDKKITYVFRWWDHNKDGYVTEDDMETMFQMYLTMAGDAGEEARNLVRKGVGLWRQILWEGRQDQTNDKIDRQEFVRIMRDVSHDTEKFDNSVMMTTHGVLSGLDTDKNGSLSLEEYTRLYNVIGLDPNQAPEAFKRLDRDHSGEISRAELTEAIREMYISQDPEAPGNWLLGPIHLFEE